MALKNKIVGLTAKIGADTSDFTRALKSLDKEINTTAKTADALQKSLELDFDDKRFLQAQKQAQAALDATNAKAKAIREQLKYLEEHGGVDTEGYRKLEVELAKTETQALKLEQQLKNIEAIDLSNRYKDFYESIKKSSDALSVSKRNAESLTEKLKDTSIYGKNFSKVQEAATAQLRKTKEEAERLKQQLQTASEKNIPIEDYEALSKQLGEAENAAKLLSDELERSKKINLDRLSNQVNNISEKLDKAARGTRALSTAAGAAIAGIYKLGTDVAKTGGELQDYADRLNVSAEAMQRWQYIAMQSGVETDQLSNAMAKSRDAIGTALSGETNTATKALEALVGDLSKLPSDTEKGFDVIINALANVKDSTMQAYYANEIFGERLATNLIPMINNGSDKLKQLNGEFEAIGYLSNEDVQALADFDDKMNIVTQKFTLAKQELAIALLPIIEKMTTFITEKVIPLVEKLAEKFDKLSDSQKDNVLKWLLIAMAISPVLTLISKVIKIVPTLVKSITKINTAVGRLSLGLGTLVMVGLIIGQLVESWGDMSVAQRIVAVIGVITAAVLGLAVAFGVFHSAWSLGAAVTFIIAGIAASVAAINAAKKSIDTDIPDFNAKDYNITSGGYSIPSASSMRDASESNYYEDNSNYDININMEASGELTYDAKSLADEVIKEIALKKQARG